MRKKQMKAILAVFAIVLAVTSSGCTQNSGEKIQIGLLPIADALPFYVAEEKGYFRAEGLNVELVTFQSAVERDSAMQAREIDGSIGDIVAVAALNNSGTQTKIVSLGLGESGREGRFAVVSPPGSGLVRPEQLKNVPVAISTNSIIEYVTDNLLLEKGLKPDEIKKEAIPKIPVRYDLLMKGQIRAACLPDPYAALAESRGANLVADDTESNLSQTVIYFRNDFLEKNGKETVLLLKAYAKAARGINENPAQYRDLLIDKAKVPPEAVDVFRMDHYPAPRLPEKEQVERVIRWMFDKGLLKNIPGYEDLTAKGFIPADD
ncbi:MAG TPA: MetQ/NlpA family ABC transporter substrate-binding protein [Bacillota bacterium]|nr:MetQ/NlpA family ABC transporter substrate-binding protein [Bacillota bacterium]